MAKAVRSDQKVRAVTQPFLLASVRRNGDAVIVHLHVCVQETLTPMYSYWLLCTGVPRRRI